MKRNNADIIIFSKEKEIAKQKKEFEKVIIPRKVEKDEFEIKITKEDLEEIENPSPIDKIVQEMQEIEENL